MEKLSIIIPCFNEDKTVNLVIDKLLSLDLGQIKKEIIVINDNSTDNTSSLLKKFSSDVIKVITHTQNLGKTNAIKTGLEFTTGDYTIIQDADLEYDPRDIKLLIAKATAENLSVVYGSRRLKNNPYSYLSYLIGANLLTLFSNQLFKQNLTDIETCYKLIRTDLLKQLTINSKNFAFENEITAKLAKLGIKIQEVPINYYPRTKAQGKKIKFRHWLEALITTIKNR